VADTYEGPAPAVAGGKPLLIIVSGCPGSGKSTLARLLVNKIACPLVSRDEINEGIWHTLRHDPEVAGKEQVAKTAFEVFFQTIGMLLSSQVTLVAEAAYQDRLWRTGLEPIAAAADLRIIHCVLEQAQAAERRVRRQQERSMPRRPGAPAEDPAAATSFAPTRSFTPLSLPVPSLLVDTADGYRPGFDEIDDFALADAESAGRSGP
jgi:predicted kinase